MNQIIEKSLKNKKHNRLKSIIAAMAGIGLCSDEDARYIKEVILDLDERFGLSQRKCSHS